ncbi:hypothetical protein G6F24_016587 [Rhizopus arrhizus]|nr:hypothetical protein G6F24_016587 [Rhizopus arrhizus]
MPSTSSQNVPNSMPPITSLSQCAPRYSREKPIRLTTMPDTRYGQTRVRPGISRAISTAKKPKVMVAMVTDTDGKPKPLLASTGRTTSTVAPSSMVSARPKASAASQCAAAIQRRRQIR